LPLTGDDEYEAETFFPMRGMAIRVMKPVEPSGTYHWETEQEDFLVLFGEAVLIVEGQERALKQWNRALPARDAARVRGVRRRALRPPLRELAAVPEGWLAGLLCSDETAARYNASWPEDTQDVTLAYARFPPPRATRYREGLLPDDANS
jgi:hypothetical protein